MVLFRLRLAFAKALPGNVSAFAALFAIWYLTLHSHGRVHGQQKEATSPASSPAIMATAALEGLTTTPVSGRISYWMAIYGGQILREDATEKYFLDAISEAERQLPDRNAYFEVFHNLLSRDLKKRFTRTGGTPCELVFEGNKRKNIIQRSAVVNDGTYNYITDSVNSQITMSSTSNISTDDISTFMPSVPRDYLEHFRSGVGQKHVTFNTTETGELLAGLELEEGTIEYSFDSNMRVSRYSRRRVPKMGVPEASVTMLLHEHTAHQGVEIPRHVYHYRTNAGVVTSAKVYLVESASFNTPVDSDAFLVGASKGNIIVDERSPGQQVAYRARTNIPDLGATEIKAPYKEPERQQAIPANRGHFLLLITVNALLIACLGAYVYARRCRSAQKGHQ